MSRSILFAILLLACSSCFAHSDPSRPLPPAVLAARSIYIDNQTGDNALAQRARQELAAWGRFVIVTTADKADITLTISTQSAIVPGGEDEEDAITLQILIPHDDIPQFSCTQESEVRFMEEDVTKALRLFRRHLDDQEKAQSASESHDKVAQNVAPVK